MIRAANGVTTFYVGDLYEVDSGSGIATAYYPFNGKPVAMKKGSTLTYLHHDQLGSLVSATDVSGAEIASARYWPFGGLRSSTGTLPSDRLFTGQIRDAIGGVGNDAFYFFKARYLDTTIGKFHTPDTIVPAPGNPQALNRYSYVLNQLLKLTDPTGHMASIGNDGSPNPGDIPPLPPDPGTPPPEPGTPPPDPGTPPPDPGTPPGTPTGSSTPTQTPSPSPAPTATPAPVATPTGASLSVGKRSTSASAWMAPPSCTTATGAPGRGPAPSSAC